VVLSEAITTPTTRYCGRLTNRLRLTSLLAVDYLATHEPLPRWEEQKLCAIKRLQRELVGSLPIRQGESPAKPGNAPIREVLARGGSGKVADVLDLLIRGGLRLYFRSVSDGQEGFRVNYENNTLITRPLARRAPFVQIALRRFLEQLLPNAQCLPERYAGWVPRRLTARK
jgi:hypothetical protein